MNPIAPAFIGQSLSLNFYYSLNRSRQSGQTRSQTRSQSLCSLTRSRQNGQSQSQSQNRNQSLYSLNRSRQSGYPLNRRRGRVSTSLNTSNESETRTTLLVGKIDVIYSISYHWFAATELFPAELVSGCGKRERKSVREMP